MILLSQDYRQHSIGGTIGSPRAEFIDCENGKILTDGDNLFYAEISDPKNAALRMNLQCIMGGCTAIRPNGPGNPIQYVIPKLVYRYKDDLSPRSTEQQLFNIMKPKTAS